MGIRVIKTAIAALAALYTAHYLGLETPLSAGLLAILGVEVTRMRGLRSAFERFMASVLGLFFASLLFILLGFHLWTISIFVLLAFPILSRFHLKDGIVTSAVIVFHVYAKEEVTTSLIGNEIMLLLTGLGWATVINMLYMPKEEHKLMELRHLTEEKFGRIFQRMAMSLRSPALVWNGEELLEAEQAIEEGIRRSDISRANRIWGHGSEFVLYWPNYFEMRRQQLDAISSMLTQLALIYESLPQGELAAELFEHLSDDVKSDVYEGAVEAQRRQLKARFRSMPLPVSREEFEMRAALLHLVHELDRYLAIAKRLKKQKNSLMAAVRESD
ncbi:aromatic acid exporter family protein [Paenibacillus montanisoli]|uniref:Aromatic acid exporter family protein n=1 Tax=Paenibacillus montanisoli TaxID=2081970 RepID=A0A328UCY8_9BACL|nr:aromatic acid exporter family protein [Paenibacillus montanisoli]RAP78194.1 aromatic acid exporter family protein [Paenibacillus montanisoli]